MAKQIMRCGVLTPHGEHYWGDVGQNRCLGEVMIVDTAFPTGFCGIYAKHKAHEAVGQNHEIITCIGFTEPAPVRRGNVNKRAEVLHTAEELINGERAQTYGPPEESFGRIAELLNAMGWRVDNWHTPGQESYRKLNAVDAALALTQLKVSRIISSPDHEDSWVDAAGYIALGAEISLKGKNNG